MKRLYTILFVLGGYYISHAQFVTVNPSVSIGAVNDIEAGGTGRMIFATDKGVLVYDGSNWKQFSANNNIHALEPYNGGFLYTTGKKQGVCDYSAEKEEEVNYPGQYNITAVHVNAKGDTVMGLDNGTFLVATTGNRWAIGENTIGEKIGRVNEIGEVQNTAGTVSLHIVATDNKAVFYQVSQGAVAVLSSSNAAIPSDNVLCLAVDGTMVYFGYDSGGITYADANDFPAPDIEEINKANTPELPSNRINDLIVKNGSLFIATNAGLAVRINGKWKIYTTANSNIPSNDITELAFTGSDLWVGTKDAKIARISINELTSVSRVEVTPPAVSVYPNPAVNTIYVNVAAQVTGNFIISDMTGRTVAAYRIDKQTNTFSVTQLSPGIYSYRLMQDNGSISQAGKLTIE